MRSGDRGAPNLLEQMGYETRDITLPRIFFWIGVLFAFVFGSMALVFGLYIFFIPNYARLGQPSPIPKNRRLPPNPQIQLEPRRDFVQYRIAEDNAQNAPEVQRAIDTLSEQGISGVRGGDYRQRGPSYPGSGNYLTPGGGETGDTNVLPSNHDPQVGEKPLPGGTEKRPGERSQTPALGNGMRPVAPSGADTQTDTATDNTNRENGTPLTPSPEAGTRAE